MKTRWRQGSAEDVYLEVSRWWERQRVNQMEAEPFGSGIAEEGWQCKGFYSRRERTKNILERKFFGQFSIYWPLNASFLYIAFSTLSTGFSCGQFFTIFSIDCCLVDCWESFLAVATSKPSSFDQNHSEKNPDFIWSQSFSVQHLLLSIKIVQWKMSKPWFILITIVFSVTPAFDQNHPVKKPEFSWSQSFPVHQQPQSCGDKHSFHWNKITSVPSGQTMISLAQNHSMPRWQNIQFFLTRWIFFRSSFSKFTQEIDRLNCNAKSCLTLPLFEELRLPAHLLLLDDSKFGL
jgi:hypothetical protein